MSSDVVSSPAKAGDGQGGGGEVVPHAYRRPMPATWFTRNPHYFWYVVREFTAAPLALWLLWFLYYVGREQRPSTAFAIFSVVCLPFALYHSITFLSLAGSIIHLKLFEKPIAPRLIVASQFALWIGATVLVGLLLIWLAR